MKMEIQQNIMPQVNGQGRKTNEEFEKAVPGVSDEGVECVKDICRYIYEEYGKLPAFNDTMHLLYFKKIIKCFLDPALCTK